MTALVKKRTSRVTWAVAGVLLVAILQACLSLSERNEAAALKAQQQAQAESEATVACKSTLDDKKKAYAGLLDQKRYWDAFLALGDCPNLLHDGTLVAMRDGAARLHYVAAAGDAKAIPADRIRAIDWLKSNSAADAPQFETARTQLQSQLDRQALADAKRLAANEKAAKRKTGVSIGMSKQDVLDSSWGRPEKVNTTTNARGVTEQWVYPSGSYLYFADGTLSTIQN